MAQASISLPTINSLIDKILLGFFAYFGWQLAVWVDARFIPG